MIPKRVTLKDFLSFGDEQTLDFTGDDALWILTGPNGVGKSAVFDAITYCLFGCHRGGKDGAHNLIRHGANAFRVAFEFQLDGTDYRIARTRGANVTQRLERLIDGGDRSNADHWKPIPNVNNAGDVAAWVERTLGLGFESFTKSVLLRQGESDEIVEATGKKRLEILNSIIDVKRFEALVSRIDGERKRCKDRLEDVQQRRENAREVTAEQLVAARAALAAAVDARTVAHEARQTAAQGVERAKQYARLSEELAALAEQLLEADERSKARGQIERDHARWTVLKAVVPPLKKIAAGSVKIAAADARHRELSVALEKLQRDRDSSAAALEAAKAEASEQAERLTASEAAAKRFGEEIERESRFLAAAEQADELSTNVRRFAADLDAKLQEAGERFGHADRAKDAAATAKTEASTQLKQVKEQQAEFETVGPTCSKCRQSVSAEHAAEERAGFARDIAAFTKRLNDAERDWQDAKAQKLAAKEDADALTHEIQERNTLQATLDAQKKTLGQLGISADPQKLKRQLEDKRRSRQEHESTARTAAELRAKAESHAQRLERTGSAQGKQQNALEGELTNLAQALAGDRAVRDALLAGLEAEWQPRAEIMTEREADNLGGELEKLDRSRVADRFAALQSDSHAQIGWQARREQVRKELAELPSQSIAEAELNSTQAVQAAAHADEARDDARAEVDRLEHAIAAFQELLADIATAEADFRRRRKLYDWLGREGLLRDLVRDAERDIVRFAQETLGRLSGGDLEIELETSDDSTEALKLSVRQAGASLATPVKFLSGSQKFRVAVAIAVAIGKFASGTSSSRPLESVIIDEGFGSLDKDGLQAMREELEKLKETQALKRVIFVSHQEEFTSRFSVGYRLAAGANGAVATAFRQ